VSNSYLPALADFDQARCLLERAVTYFQPDPRVTALIVGGSIAHNTVDSYSDIDLWIVAGSEEDFTAVFAEREIAAASIGEPLFRFIADHNPKGDQDYIVMYEGLTKLDFMYYRPSDMMPHVKWKECLILKDANGLAADIKAQSQSLLPPAPSAEELLALNQKFWTWCWYVFGKIMRGELWEALDGIHSIRSLALLPMLAWIEGYSQEGYRRLESKLRNHKDLLAATIADLEPQSLYASLQAEMVLFIELRDILFSRLALKDEYERESLIKDEIANRWENERAS
jgi:predicted nucleotidyltransferase